MFATNALRNITNEDRAEIEAQLYENEEVTCVDAVHPSPYGIEDGTSETYTWFIPTGTEMSIEPGDALVVEQTVGFGLAIVMAVSKPYQKTRDMHEQEIHPYCPVISNLGASRFI